MRNSYPFAAIVGQDALKDALLWIAVDPKIGGLLITGTRGTAKSTAARGLADLLSPVTPFVELPVGATEDRVVGTLDVQALLADGQRRFEPGLLARANRGVLYVDEVNLLPDHIVDVMLDVAATGVNVVERDGASHRHEAQIMLIGSMNPEEGDLRPQLLDRFGLSVNVENDADIERRAEIAARRIQFEHDSEAFRDQYGHRSDELRKHVARASELLAHVTTDREILVYAARLAVEANVEGMRADLTIVRTARAIAALDGRSHVAVADVERAAPAALAHRRRERPAPPPPLPPRSQFRDLEQSSEGESGGERQRGEERAITFDIGAMLEASLPADDREVTRAQTSANATRGSGALDVARGITRASSRRRAPIAPLATIRAAALERRPFEGAALQVAGHHLRYVHRRGRRRQLVIFVVDASGSMAAAARMRAAKGAVCGLLERAYHCRDAVALVTFRGDCAQLVVPPTRSAALAYRRLRTIPTGGRTPLADGLRLAAQTAVHYGRRDAGARSNVVLVTDGRCNVPAYRALDEALGEATGLRMLGVRALCIDTESDRVRLGNAMRIARALGAQYRRAEDCSEMALGAAVREWMAVA